MDEKRELLRHMLAIVAYRATRALEGAPDHFAGFAGAGRMPVQILAHMGDLFDWALSAAMGQERWRATQPRAWAEEQQRFFQSLQTFDAFLATGGPALRQPHARGELLCRRDQGRPGRRGPARRGEAVQGAIGIDPIGRPTASTPHPL